MFQPSVGFSSPCKGINMDQQSSLVTPCSPITCQELHAPIALGGIHRNPLPKEPCCSASLAWMAGLKDHATVSDVHVTCIRHACCLSCLASLTWRKGVFYSLLWWPCRTSSAQSELPPMLTRFQFSCHCWRGALQVGRGSTHSGCTKEHLSWTVAVACVNTDACPAWPPKQTCGTALKWDTRPPLFPQMMVRNSTFSSIDNPISTLTGQWGTP